MNGLAFVEDVTELDYALAMQDQQDLDAAWEVLEAGLIENGYESWNIDYEKHEIYRQREVSSKWNRLMQLARREEIAVPVPQWITDEEAE